MKAGERIRVQACKTDGTVYRSWHTTIESVDADSIVTISPANQPVFDIVRKQYFTEHVLRSYYWHDKYYNLIEVFEPSGELLEIYINVASPPEFNNDELSFKDHELDISKYPPRPAVLVDEDEFVEATAKYHYSSEFQEAMYAAAREALELAESWKARPFPHFPESQS